MTRHKVGWKIFQQRRFAWELSNNYIRFSLREPEKMTDDREAWPSRQLDPWETSILCYKKKTLLNDPAKVREKTNKKLLGFPLPQSCKKVVLIASLKMSASFNYTFCCFFLFLCFSVRIHWDCLSNKIFHLFMYCLFRNVFPLLERTQIQATK